jgi:gamma-glutamyltranspeptidase/glutathione hydrolase
MAPTIVLKDGAPVAVLGSPGGSRIIGYVAKTVIALLDWGMDPQAAVALPHAVNRFGRYDLEEGGALAGLRAGLEALRFEVAEGALNSGLHVVTISGNGLRGGADPRREGIALGE